MVTRSHAIGGNVHKRNRSLAGGISEIRLEEDSIMP